MDKCNTLGIQSTNDSKHHSNLFALAKPIKIPDATKSRAFSVIDANANMLTAMHTPRLTLTQTETRALTPQ